jgi:Na+/alanine symporter
MDVDALSSFGHAALLYGALPLLLLAALVVSARLGFPQFMCIIDGLRSSKSHDSEAAGELRPHTALTLSAVATYGVAGTVGAVTAIGIGGPAVIAWSWILALLIAPLAMAETFIARTDVTGGASGPSQSMTRHLFRSDQRGHR